MSHAHADHNHPSVRGWFDQGLCRLCVGEDVPGAGVERFEPGDSRVVDSAIIRAFGSTDQGVSFWVESGGLKVFHAGISTCGTGGATGTRRGRAGRRLSFTPFWPRWRAYRWMWPFSPLTRE